MYAVQLMLGFVFFIAGAVLRYRVTKIASVEVGGDYTTVQKHIRAAPTLRKQNNSGYLVRPEQFSFHASAS